MSLSRLCTGIKLELINQKKVKKVSILNLVQKKLKKTFSKNRQDVFSTRYQQVDQLFEIWSKGFANSALSSLRVLKNGVFI
jgi:hypothetical protein